MITDAQRQMVSNILGGDLRGMMLRKGGRGKTVRALQLFLADQGIDVGKADGKFGDRTLAALKQYQKNAGITVDGKAGQQTFGAIRKGVQGSYAIPREKPTDTGMTAPAVPVDSAPLPPLPEPSPASPLPHPQTGHPQIPPMESPMGPPDEMRSPPMPPPDLEIPSFGGTDRFGSAFGNTPNFDDPINGLNPNLLYPEISMPPNTGSPGQNAQNAFGLDQLAQALKARVNQRAMQANAHPGLTGGGAGNPGDNLAIGGNSPITSGPTGYPVGYENIIRALMSGQQ